MGIFSSILHKIFHHSEAAPASGTSPAPAAPGQATNAAPGSAPAPSPAAAPDNAQNSSTNAAPATLGQADVEKILTELAAKKGGGGNWRTSIVDLLRMLDLDSSLNARKELAGELNVHAGEHGSAEQNIALSKAVWQQLAQNGGKVPDSLKG
jgi:hypothetical protein